MRRAELVRRLAALPGLANPRPELEQVATPPEAAADLLESATARGDLVGRSVADLGCGTGRLGLGAAWLGAARVVGWDIDPASIALARAASTDRPEVTWEVRAVEPPGPEVDTVVMNPPFGAQRAHADRPFWETALARGPRAVYGFALADSRSFIEGRAVAHAARIEERRPIDWRLAAIFRHHRKPSVRLSVDLWVLRRASIDERV